MIRTSDQIKLLIAIKNKNELCINCINILNDIIYTLNSYSGKDNTGYIVNMSKEDYIKFIESKNNQI